MEAYYSSDDEVAWGPVTIKEIKSDLKKRVMRKPDKRHTTHFEQTTDINKMSITSEDTILDISAYLTASETASVKTDTEFHSTSETYSKNNILHDHFDEVNKSLGKNCQRSPANYERADISHLNFVQNAMAKPNDVIITDEHLTLVESPSKSINKTVHTNEFNVIDLSSDDEAEQDRKTNLSYILEVSDDSDPNSYYSKMDCRKQEELESCYKNIDDFSPNQSKLDESKYCVSPAITIPDIDLQQFNDSSICPLNDTIEKINAILNQAEDLSFTESSGKNDTEYDNDREVDINIKDLHISTGCKQNSTSDKSEYIDNIQSCNLISGSFLQKPVADLSPKKTPKANKQIKCNSAGKRHIPIPKSSPNSFKMPTLPIQKTKPNLKDIVSPVRMYIKYSPKSVIQRNTVETKKLQKPLYSKGKENMDIIPSNIVYTPSKNPVLGSERNIRLPESIEKMVVKSTVTKHERNPVSVSLFKKDISLDSNSELTNMSFNESELNKSDHDISVLHKKPAFRK